MNGPLGVCDESSAERDSDVGHPATRTAEEDELTLSRRPSLPGPAAGHELFMGIAGDRGAHAGQHLLYETGAIEAERRPSPP